MPKMVVYELFEVDAASPEAAASLIQKRSKRVSVVMAAEYLDQLPHPVHLQEAQDMFTLSPTADAPVIVEASDK
jgi:hypothetical protein